MANIIIVGCGRVGSQLATLLSQGDGNVCVVDRNAAAFSNLDRNFNGNTLQLSLIHIYGGAFAFAGERACAPSVPPRMRSLACAAFALLSNAESFAARRCRHL